MQSIPMSETKAVQGAGNSGRVPNTMGCATNWAACAH